MQPKKISTSFFTSILSPGGNTAKKAGPPASPSWSLYRDLAELPLDNFIRVICDEDKSALIKEPYPGPIPPVLALRKALQESTEEAAIKRLQGSQDRIHKMIHKAQPGKISVEKVQSLVDQELQLQREIDSLAWVLHQKKEAVAAAEEAMDRIVGQVWDDLFMDYLDASKENQVRYKFEVEREAAIMRSRLTRIESSVMILRLMFVPDLVEELYSIDDDFRDFPLDFEGDPDGYFEDLDAIFQRSRDLKIDLELKELELENIVENESKQVHKKATRISFTNVLSRLAAHRGVVVIHSSQLSVLEFVSMFNQYLDDIKALKAVKPRKA
jgi:hypothetical protein